MIENIRRELIDAAADLDREFREAAATQRYTAEFTQEFRVCAGTLRSVAADLKGRDIQQAAAFLDREAQLMQHNKAAFFARVKIMGTAFSLKMALIGWNWP